MNAFNFSIQQIYRQVAASLPYEGRVIDLGCGTAQYKEIILKTAKEYIGVDWQNCLHDQSKVDVFANLCEPLPFKDNYADTVTSFQVMEHLPEPDFFLSECYRILRKGGRLIITVPFMWAVHEAPYDYFRYTRYGLEYLLKKQGFIEIEIIEVTGFWLTWVLKFNYHTHQFLKYRNRVFSLFKVVLLPIWLLGQLIAPILDKYDKHPQETSGYVVVAKKP